MIIERDYLFRVMCNIRIPQSAGKEEIGSGIFVSKNNEPYLLTASHVVKNSNPGAYLILSDSSSSPTKLQLSVFSKTPQWTHHPTADLAYMPITLDASNRVYLNDRCFPYDHIEQNLPSRDTELTCIGFPLGLGAQGKFSPLTFRTYAASGLVQFNRFDLNTACDFFVLENPSVGGYSGGPVFDLGYMITGMMRQNKEKTLLHGIMHGTLTDATGGKMAAVTPTSYLKGFF